MNKDSPVYAYLDYDDIMVLLDECADDAELNDLIQQNRGPVNELNRDLDRILDTLGLRDGAA